MKRISEDVRRNILSLLDAGVSGRQIAQRLGVSTGTVHNVRASSKVSAQKNQGGRPFKLTATDKRQLVRMVTSGQVDTAVQATRELRDAIPVDFGVDTVRRALREAGLKAMVKQKKPRLLPRHIRQRLAFAIKYQHWTVHDWRRGVFSDETKINRLGSDGCKWGWRKPGGMLTERDVQGTVKFGGGSLMMWGCMTARGVGYASRIDGRMDAALYTQILDDELLQSLEFYGLEVDDVFFQQDNDPKHTSRVAQEWFEEHGLEVLDWPSQSPDLNPIEHLWAHLKRQLNGYDAQPSSMHELWQRVEVEWDKIPVQVCVDLIDSMPRRIAAVLKAKGGYTKY